MGLASRPGRFIGREPFHIPHPVHLSEEEMERRRKFREGMVKLQVVAFWLFYGLPILGATIWMAWKILVHCFA